MKLTNCNKIANTVKHCYTKTNIPMAMYMIFWIIQLAPSLCTCVLSYFHFNGLSSHGGTGILNNAFTFTEWLEVKFIISYRSRRVWVVWCFINTLRPKQNGCQLPDDIPNAFSWMKIYKFRLRFHWSLFPRVQLTITHHWFRYWLGAGQATSHYLDQWLLVYWRIYASLGLNELIGRDFISDDYYRKPLHSNLAVLCSKPS